MEQEMIYRLEFNEKQQCFHMDRGRHEENTFGWITVASYCTDMDFYIFESFIDSKNKKRMTEAFVIATWDESRRFLRYLKEYGIKIDFARYFNKELVK